MSYAILDVIDSIINGQYEQAARQFIEGKLTFKEFDKYRLSDMPGETAKLADAVMLQLSKPIDVSEEIKLLQGQQTNKDIEGAHCTADDIICSVLKKLGYDNLIDEYKKVDKRYA